jgi:hypothetical protein
MLFTRQIYIELIMAGLGLMPDSTEQYALCYDLINRHCSRIGQNADELLDEATRVYHILSKHAARQRQKSITPSKNKP